MVTGILALRLQSVADNNHLYSVEGSYPSPMSATLAYAQAPEGSHD